MTANRLTTFFFTTLFFLGNSGALASEPQSVSAALGAAGVGEKDHESFCAECQKLKAADPKTPEGQKAKAEAEKNISEILKRNNVASDKVAKALESGGLSSDQAKAFTSNQALQANSVTPVNTVAVTKPKEVDLSHLLGALGPRGHGSRD